METISAVLTVAAQVAGSAGLVTVSSKAANWMQQRARYHDDAEMARHILGLHQSAKIAYRHDSRHILYAGTGQLHPDNLYGLTAASGNDFTRALQANNVEITDYVTARMTNDLVLIGSPTSEALSRIVFGYHQDSGSEDSLSRINAPLDLPYSWEISKFHVDERALAQRFVAGKGLVARPNWRIVGPDRTYVPRVDEDGMLEEDYLLVTRVRNFLSTASLDTGHFVISFGGTHGTGTRALNLLYRDKSVLRKLAEKLRSAPAAFQVLLRVGNIKHDSVLGSYGQSIEVVEDPVVLPDREAIWTEAARQVRSEVENS